MSIQIFDRELLPAAVARAVAAALFSAASKGHRISLCLSGGTTPRASYEALAEHREVPWELVEVFFGDERAVELSHPDSNFRMAREALLTRVTIAPENVHAMPAARADRDAAAREYADKLPEKFDVLILGIGEDCHTASLFPGSWALAEEQRKVVPVIGPKPPPERLSITPRMIQGASHCFVLAAGAGKAEAVFQGLQGELQPQKYPAQLARSATWLVDKDAARLLRL